MLQAGHTPMGKDSCSVETGRIPLSSEDAPFRISQCSESKLGLVILPGTGLDGPASHTAILQSVSAGEERPRPARAVRL